MSALESRSSGLPVALSAPRHGDFPRSISGSKLPVCPLRGHACPAPQKTANAMQHSKSETYKRNRSSHIVSLLACMLLRHWIACNRSRKKLPRGIIIQNVKSKLTCNAISVQHLQEGGMERVSPVQLAFFQTLMA